MSDVDEDAYSPELLRRRGVPDKLIPYAADYSVYNIPGRSDRIRLELGNPELPPVGESDLVEAAELGMAFVWEASAPTDLFALGASIPLIEELELIGDGECYSGFRALEGMQSLRSLISTPTRGDADLSGLPRLEQATIHSPGMVSVARNPAVRQLVMEFPGAPAPTEFAPELEALAITARTLDIGAIAQLRGLSILTIDSRMPIDVTALAHHPSLTSLSLARCKSVTGVSALRSVPNLRRLAFLWVPAVDDPLAILPLNLDWFEVNGNRVFDSEFAKSADEKQGHWRVDKPLIANARADSAFETVPGSQGRNLRLSEVGVTALHSAAGPELTLGSTEEIELFLRRVVQLTCAGIIDEYEFSFDGDDDEIVLRFPTGDLTKRVRRRLESLWERPAELKSAMR